MALDKTLRDINRRELEFGNNQIAKALPEYFGADYPKLISLLNAYYAWLDSDGNFGHKLKTLPTSRDIAQTAKENLTYMSSRRDLCNRLKNLYRQSGKFPRNDTRLSPRPCGIFVVA